MFLFAIHYGVFCISVVLRPLSFVHINHKFNNVFGYLIMLIPLWHYQCGTINTEYKQIKSRKCNQNIELQYCFSLKKFVTGIRVPHEDTFNSAGVNGGFDGMSHVGNFYKRGKS